MATAPTIDFLLNLVPDDSAAVLSALSNNQHLASARDAHGYSLVHAACSYDQLDLLRALVKVYGASPNIRDEDEETPLFFAESVEAARCLVEELGADINAQNNDGVTAAEKIEEEEDYPLVAFYLRSKLSDESTEIILGE